MWVCLFTCLATRAVHLELLQDMFTEEFLNGFRRFISQRGSPLEVINDKALQFKAVSRTLELIWKQVIRCEKVQTYLSNAGVRWTFIVELAPWMGDFMKGWQSKSGCKDQESIQASTTPDPGYQWESDKLTVDTTNESKEVSPFPAGDHKAHINRRTQRHSKHKTEQKHKRSTKEVPPWNGQ